jgi:hypothetical protein
MALTNLVALVPAAPGYVGTFDAAVLLAVNLLAAGARGAGLAYVVLVRFVLFVPITLVGGAVLLRTSLGREAKASREGEISGLGTAPGLRVPVRPAPAPGIPPAARSSAPA